MNASCGQNLSHSCEIYFVMSICAVIDHVYSEEIGKLLKGKQRAIGERI